MYKAIIFDLDDTLYDYEQINEKAIQELCDYTCKQFGISASLFWEAFDWGRNITKQCLGDTGASHNRLLYCQKILEYIGQNPVCSALDMYEVYWGYMLDHMMLRDGAAELLEFCKENAIKVGICTDLTAHIQHRKIKKLGLAPWIHALVTSEEAGAEKPAPIMYQLILDKLKVSPEHALFIGDSLKKDVQGAELSGMKALWFHPHCDTSYRTISSLREVKEIIHAEK